MTEIRSIIDELRHAHNGSPWHGSSRADLLRGVTAAGAASRPIANVHTIWELVLHMTAWTAEVARRTRGHPAGTPQEGDWPEQPSEPSDREWQAAIATLGEAHADLVRTVQAFPESGLATPVGDERNPALGSGVTYGAMLHGVAQHDAYHSGQIALLKKLSPTAR
ncbi:MAG: DinB family protein [Anaerolineae bacterium]|nr:DinB family protein [Gemmatimonadaceae bacterium]